MVQTSPFSQSLSWKTHPSDLAPHVMAPGTDYWADWLLLGSLVVLGCHQSIPVVHDQGNHQRCKVYHTHHRLREEPSNHNQSSMHHITWGVRQDICHRMLFDSHGNFMIMHTHRAAAHISEVFVKQNVLLALWATTLLISTKFVLHHFSLYL